MRTTEPESVERGRLARAALVLVSGTALAHGLSALALPVLSRLYSPTDFGMLAVFSGALSIIGVAACLRFDLAVPMPESDDDALHLLALSLICACAVSLLLAVAITLGANTLAGLLGQPGLEPHLWLLPVGVLAAGGYSAFQSWQIRRKQFGLLSRTRVAQSAVSAGVQIGLGALSPSPFGLLLGYVTNAGIACLALGGDLMRALPRLEPVRMWVLAHEYRRFPTYSTLEAMSNSAAIQLPIILIAALAAPAEAGFLSMAMFAMQVPMALIGTAIGQVYLSQATEEHRMGRLGPFTAKVLGSLIKIGIGPLIAAGILAPTLFGIILGAPWARAGLLVSWMVPWFAMQFLASPVSMALHVAGHQRRALFLQLGALVMRTGIVLATAQVWPAAIAESYALSGFAVYIAYLFVVMRTSGTSLQQVFSDSKSAFAVTSAWVVVSLVVAASLRGFA